MKTCNYCPKPIHVWSDGTESMLCPFHTDHAAACNIAEDEGNGHIHGPRVDELMREWGWSDEQLAEERRQLERFSP